MGSIAVTGACGRLGRALCANPWWSQHHTLTKCARAADEQKGVLACESLLDGRVLSEFDGLFHLAWSCVPSSAEQRPGCAQKVDLPLLERLLESAVRAGEQRGSPLHVVFPSTGAVYGNSLHETGSRESDPLHPLGEYARGKAAAECLIQTFVTSGNLSVATLRVSNLYGFPGTQGPPQGVIPRMVRAALDGTPFELWGADTEKDYLHIDDLLDALAATFDQRLTGLYNVASGRSLRLREIIAIIENLTGRSIEVHAAGGELSWDVSRNRLDPSRWLQAVGWVPQVSFEEGIRRLIEEMSD